MFCNTAMRKNIGNLAYGVNAAASCNHFIKQCRLRCRYCVIVTVGCAGKIRSTGADERTRYYPGNIIRLHQLKSQLAQIIQALQAKGFLVRCYLQHAVGGGINNRLAASYMLLAQLLDDFGTTGMAFAQHSRQIALADNCIHQLLRKAFRHILEIAPVKFNRHTADFPMSAQCILTAADLLRIGISTDCMLGAQACRQRFTTAQLSSCLQSVLSQMRQMQRLRRFACVTRIFRQPIADMAQGICTLITVRLGIMGITDTEGIQQQNNSTCHFFTCFLKQKGAANTNAKQLP